MLFETGGDLFKLGESFGEYLLQVRDGMRRANARHDVLALRVHEKFAVENFLARAGVAREANARARRVAHIAEHHGLDVRRRADVVRNLFHLAVVSGLRSPPAAEHRVARHRKLLTRILREGLARLLLNELLVILDDGFEIVGRQVRIQLGLDLRFAGVEDVVELRHVDIQRHFAEHLNEAAVAVVGEARIAALGREPAVVVSFRPRLRIVFIIPGMENFAPERTLSSSGLDASPSFWPICFSSLTSALSISCWMSSGSLFSIVEVDIADARRDREARRHRKARAGHFGQPGALAAEHIFHGAVAVGCAAAERINVLAHLFS